MARQAIPRPPWARRAEPPSGAFDLEDAAVGLTMGAVREAFAAPILNPRDQGEALVAGAAGAAGAAVLIVLAPVDEHDGDPAASVVLIRRAAHLRANPGEIAFPGGRIEPGEEPLAAALREAAEEVALLPGAVELLGELPMVSVYRRGTPILPFVAAASQRPLVEANPDEVDCVLVVPLGELVAPGRYWQERWDRGQGEPRVMHFFDLGEDVIWGATAWMLYALFLRVLDWRPGPPVLP
jgi:8-oxo-dGTP pyrophosphatase MutT (NUDIX family)